MDKDNVRDLTLYRLNRMYKDSRSREEIDLLAEFIASYEDGIVGVVWVCGEPRFYDIDDSPEYGATVEEVLEFTKDTEDQIFDIDDAMEHLGLPEE